MTTSLFFLMWGLATALAMPLLLQFHASGVPGVRAFMLANALTVLSLLLYAAGSFLPLNATVMVSNAAWISALALVYVGVRQFFGLHPQVWRSAALAILCVVVMTAMLYGQDRVAARIVLFSVITCVGMGATACVIFDGRRQIRTRGVALYLLLSILGLAALHLLRVLVYGLGWEAPGSMLHPTPWALFFIVGGSVTVPALFLALLLLVQTRMSERMQEALTFDSLTQAYSRRSFMDELQHELRRCERNDGRLVVLLLDIDFFKAINDRHGHATGDQALRHFARVVQRAVRASDRFGRLGGEEFALLMYDCEPASALVQAQRVCDALRDAPLHTVDGEIRMTVSGGGRLPARRYGGRHPGPRRRGVVPRQGTGPRPGGNRRLGRFRRGRDLGLDGAGRGGSGQCGRRGQPAGSKATTARCWSRNFSMAS